MKGVPRCPADLSSISKIKWYHRRDAKQTYANDVSAHLKRAVVLLLFDCWEEGPTTIQAGQHAFVQAAKLGINKAKDRLGQGDYWAIRGHGKRQRSTPLIPDDQDSSIDAGVADDEGGPTRIFRLGVRHQAPQSR